MGVLLRFCALRQIKAKGLDLLTRHTKVVMEDGTQLGTVMPLAYVADDGIQKFLLGLQLLGGLSQRLRVAMEPRCVIAVLGRFLIGADTGQFCGGGDSANGGQIILGHRCHRPFPLGFFF